jgi:hypothetical protein
MEFMCTNIQSAGFKRIPPDRQHEIQGGILPILVGAGIAALAEIISDWDNFKNGLMGRPEEK